MKRRPYFCARNDGDDYLQLGPRGGPYAVFAEGWERALKFKTEDELREWCATNSIRTGNIVQRSR